jgi:hypothetical protein
MAALYLTIEDNEYMVAYKIFDTNAFPEHVGSQVDACADDLALIAHSRSIIYQETLNGRREFVQELHKPYYATATPDHIKVFRYHSVTFQVGVVSFFISIYSLLDKFSRLVAALIIPSSMVGFDKLRKWLSSNVREKHMDIEKRDLIIQIINNAKDYWLDDIINKRVHITHYGTLKDLSLMQVPFSKPPSLIGEDEIILPTISFKGSRRDLVNLSQEIESNIKIMLKEIIALLPNVKYQ